MDNDRFMDALSIVSFLIGIANYNENLSQSDKDDMMQKLDETTTALLQCLKEEIKNQNVMLKEILRLLQELSTKE